MNSELHLDTRFEIYGSTIGVRNLVCYVPLCQQFNAAIQEKIPTPNLPIKLQLGPIGTYVSKVQFEKLSELQVGVLRAACDTDFEIYGSSIGVCN